MTSSAAVGPGQILFAFVRHWSRRSAADPALAEQGRLVQTCEAVHSLTERRVEPTVNAIAYEIGIDQSGASRLIKSAIAAGHVGMAASAADRRRREASLTPSGRALLAQAHRWQEDVFDRLTAGWSEQQRHDFQWAMADLMAQSYTVDAAPGRATSEAR